MSNRPVILVVDDETRLLEAVRRTLGEEFEVLCAGGSAEAEAILEREHVTAILCDQRMPGRSGVDFLCMVRERWPDPVRMIISGFTDAEDIIAAVNEAGIYQYITKPWEPDELVRAIRGAVRLYELQRLNQAVSIEMKISGAALEQVVARKRAVVRGASGFGRIVHAPDSPLAALCEEARRVAVYDVPVLITGESGTGKELLARAIHYGSHRADQPFVAENCAALPDELLESELFGSKKGAYTGAYEDRIGLFEQAEGGTIFLDEVGETSPGFQVKLLRALQEREIRPLGSRMRRKINVRVVAATNRNLEQDVRDGRFRGDLYFRLAGFGLHIPPLRERPMDVPLLAQKLLADAELAFGKTIAGYSDEMLDLMRGYSWPGNVREMQNIVHRMVILCDEATIEAAHAPAYMRERPSDDEGEANGAAANGGSLKTKIEKVEEFAISEALSRHHGNISRASAELGLSRVGLRAKMDRYGLGKSANGRE